MMGKETCFLCGSCDTEPCDECGDVFYCSDHLKYHKVYNTYQNDHSVFIICVLAW